MKDKLEEVIQNRKTAIIEQQVRDLKEYKEYSDIMEVFNDIKDNTLYDAPLMLEWNTWRAMTMLDGGEIKANYGGQSVIVPVELDVFINMVEQSYRAGYVPDAEQIKGIFKYSIEQAKLAQDENEWYAKVKNKMLNWL
ncbi:hypothetical protein E5329_01445 [Petralouisia muris]|uniref:Uncharacterized protein n=1 Tax=Petralouisia muris TaxID=3032872 RepID=A0AC61S294_9FIRM|nr:hypothetical protein [Petralouisia muris]TGY98098.1 hypothetical protein E5329_01445 [Petralouisia muris]